MIFVYIVQNLILSLKTIVCINLINIKFLLETYEKLIRNLRCCFDIICIIFLRSQSKIQKFSFLAAVTHCTQNLSAEFKEKPTAQKNIEKSYDPLQVR